MTALDGRSFGEQLRQHRLAAGLTQEELAVRSGVSVRAVSALERGVRRQPYPRTIGRLAQGLHLSKRETAQLAGLVSRCRMPRPVS